MTKYAVILSQNVHFVTTLTVPLTRTGVLYPRVRDVFIVVLFENKGRFVLVVFYN